MDNSGNENDVPDLVEQTKPENKSRKRKQSGNGRPMKKKRKNDVPELPTREELDGLRESELQKHSGLFRMQVVEMMKEVKLKENWKMEFEQWMESFKKLLFDLPESETYKINDLSWLPKKVKVPIFRNPASIKGQFKFLPPSEVTVVGSYALGVTCSRNVTVDVALEIPKECWVKTDFLNHVYHRKRAMYLAYMVKFLKKSKVVEDVKYSFQHGNSMKPVLLVTPKGVCGKHFCVCLQPYPEKSTFKLSRFIPCRNNVRPSWFFREETNNSEIPTPVYNSTILADILMPEICSFLKETISSASNYKDAIILLKVWSKQRGLNEGYRKFSGFIFSMIVAYLATIKKFTPLVSPYQVFRSTLVFIAQHKWFETGVTLSKDVKENQPSLEDFREVFDVVFVDPSGFLNIFSCFEKEAFSRVCHEADIALNMLNSNLNESFTYLFLDPVPFCRKFDTLLQIANVAASEDPDNLLSEQNEVLNHGNNFIAAVVLKMCKVLRKGLGKRIIVMDFEDKSVTTWSTSVSPSNPKVLPQITFGLLLDPEFAFSALEKGPIGTEPEAKEFREFWGDKSDLRRFREGTIHEAVVFTAKNIEEQRSIVGRMAKYILQRHCGVDPGNVHYVGNNLNTVLSVPKELLPVDDPSPGTGEELFAKFMQSFTDLSKELRALNGLPLYITSIQGVSSVFRFSEVIPPFSTSHVVDKSICSVRGCSMIPKENSKAAPSWVPSARVIVHMEGSGKWPDDKEALRVVKASFHLEIAALVKSVLSLTAVPCYEYVDILKDGYVFRLEVACHKEISLLKQVISETGAVQIKDNKEARKLEKATEILPKLNSMLHGLHQQHNSFGTACRLGKRWIAAHLLSDYIEDVTVELLVAYIYVSPAPYTVPSCPQIAFHRFLTLLCCHDWGSFPLIVNLNNQLEAEECEEIQSKFKNLRRTLPAMVISTPLDKSGCLWTREKPTAMILDRLISLSKASVEVLESQIYDPSSSDFKLIFRPPLDVYDVVIYLNPLYVPKRHFVVDLPESVKINPLKKYQLKSNEIFPVVEFDTAHMFVEHLRECFDEFALFLHDTYGGDYVAVLWKPDAFKPQPLKISNAAGRMPTTANADGSINVVPNVEAMLHYISTLGVGLIKSVDRRTEKWTIA